MENMSVLDPKSDKTPPIWRQKAIYFYFSGQQATSDLEQQLGEVITLIIIPTISILGIVGNILTGQIARTHGLNKSYNILILSLAVGDGIFLSGVNNVVLIIYMRLGSFGLHYSKSLSLFLYVCYHIQNAMDFYGRYLAMMLPTLITFERFVAVYFPLRLASIVTPYRTRVLVLIIVIAPLPINAYFEALHRFGYLLDPATNTTAGYIMRSDIFLGNMQAYFTVANIYFFITGPLPNIFVLFGCIAIGVKVNIVISSRKHFLKDRIRPSKLIKNYNDPISRHSKLPVSLRYRCSNSERQKDKAVTTSSVDNEPGCRPRQSPDSGSPQSDQRPNVLSKRSAVRSVPKSPGTPVGGRLITRDDNEKSVKLKSNQIRTTLMLVSACVVYTVTVSLRNIPIIFFTTSDWESNTGYIIERCSQLAVCINSASNILIYLIFNKRYRQTLKQIIC